MNSDTERRAALRPVAISAAGVACAFGLGALAVTVYSLLFAWTAALFVLPIMIGIVAGLAGLRSLAAAGLTLLAIVAFVGGFVLFEPGDNGSGGDGAIELWLEIAILAIPVLVILAFSMTAYLGARAFRSARHMAL